MEVCTLDLGGDGEGGGVSGDRRVLKSVSLN